MIANWQILKTTARFMMQVPYQHFYSESKRSHHILAALTWTSLSVCEYWTIEALEQINHTRLCNTFKYIGLCRTVAEYLVQLKARASSGKYARNDWSAIVDLIYSYTSFVAGFLWPYSTTHFYTIHDPLVVCGIVTFGVLSISRPVDRKQYLKSMETRCAL